MSENLSTSEDELELRTELDAVRAALGALAGELGAVDQQLTELADERQQIDLVQAACSALEKLCELGGDDLFWGDLQPSGATRIDGARQRIDGFERRYAEIEWARTSILERIEREQEKSDFLEDDLDELRREEELRKLEWVVEREIGPPADRSPVMPWTSGGEDDQRFRKSLAGSLGLAVLLALLVSLVDLPVPEGWEVTEVPERFARLIEPEPLPEQSKPERPAVQEELAETPAEEAQVAETERPEVKPAPAIETPTPAAKGILAFREKFSALADNRPAAKLGAQARLDRSGEAATGRGGRSLVSTQAPGNSGGIDLAAVSRGAVGGGGQDMEGVSVARAESSIGGVAGADRPLAGGPSAGRTDEEIQIVFDRHKAALYRLYNRALRRNPTLRGQIVLRLTIEPDGSVSLCEVHSSDMDAPELSARIAGRVQGFDFGAKDGVPALTILYPIDFLPAT